MSKLANETMQKKLNSIQSGARIFGIIGRLSLFVGVLGAVFFIISAVAHGAPKGEIVTNATMYVIYGWLFLKARDAFISIEALIKEMGEIV